MALEPVDHENGFIHYIGGSHKESLLPHGRSHAVGFSQTITDFGTPFDKGNTVSFSGDSGTFLMHGCKMIHWAGANLSQTRSRRAVGFIYLAKRATSDKEARAAYQAQLDKDFAASKKI